jgi:type VI secretion system protein ImpK
MFSDWPSQPLQEEIFGDHMAGETFFRHVRDLLAQQDSPEVADTLEVHHLCLLLGFRGRFGSADRGELSSIMQEIDAKIRRIRGGVLPFAPAWRPTDEEVAPAKDRWIRRMGMAALGVVSLAVVLFVFFALLLRGAVGELTGLTGPVG